MLAEGVSYKAWDTLVYLGNSFDCEQVVGRILREDPGKQTPLVVEVHVPVGTFAAAHAARGRYYRAEGFTQWWAKGTTWAPGGIAEALNWNRFVKHPPAVRG
jgi:predicted helicase